MELFESFQAWKLAIIIILSHPCFQAVTNDYHLHILQFSSVAQSCPTLCDPMKCSTPGLPVHHQLPEFTQTHFHRVHDAIQPSHPLSSPSLPAFNLPSIKVFSNELLLHIRWSKYWSFRFSTRPSNEYSGLINVQFSSVQSLSHVQCFSTTWTTACQASLSITKSNSCPWNQWCHPTISSSVIPFSSCLQSFPASGIFQRVSSSHQVVKVLEFQL